MFTYESSKVSYGLDDFGVLPDPEWEIEDIEREPIPEGLIDVIKKRDETLYNRMFSWETLLEVKNVPRAGDGTIDRSENDFVTILGLLRLDIPKEICMSFLMHPTLECGRKCRERRRPWLYANGTVNAAVKRMRKPEGTSIRAYDPEGKFSVQIAAHSIIERYHIAWFREGLWAYLDGYYQAGAKTAEYLALEGRLMFALRPRHLTETRSIIEEIAQVYPQDLGDSADWIAVNNGLVSLKGEGLIPATPKYFTPGRIPIDYCENIPESVYERLRAYVRSVVGEENEPLIWYQLGMSLTTDCSFIRNPVALILYGDRSTGKSELLKLIATFLGKENVSSVDVVSLSGEKDYYTWNLIGKRANITHEAPPDINVLNTGRWKTLISGDEMEVRKIAEGPISTTNYARFWMAINHSIRSKVDPALYKRFRILRTRHDFSKDPDARPGYGRNLSEDPQVLSAMFNLALEGLHELKRLREFPMTKDTIESINELREANNSVEEFIVDYTSDAPGYFETATSWYNGYTMYCKDVRKCEPVGVKMFRKRVEEILIDRMDLHLEYDPHKWVPEKKNAFPVWIGRKVNWVGLSVKGTGERIADYQLRGNLS